MPTGEPVVRRCPTSPCGADYPTDGGDDDYDGELLLMQLRLFATLCGANPPWIRERDGGEEKKEGARRLKKELTYESHLHVSSTSAKPPFKIAKWPNVNGFDSWMVKNS